MVGSTMPHFAIGYLSEPLKIDEPRFRIQPTPEFSQTVAEMNASPYRHQDWIYAPSTPDPPFRAIESFTLEPTHSFELPGSRDLDLAKFLVVTLGFLKGIHLFPKDWVHFYRACIGPATLVDFYITDRATTRVLNLASDTFAAASDVEQRLLFGAVHWYLFTERYEHLFERFGGQYTVLDTCWRIHSNRNSLGTKPHSERPEILSATLGVPLPPWGLSPAGGGQSYLVKLRNAFAHEGLFGGKPIGFSYHLTHPNIVLELRCFNARLLLALLGETDPFVHSPVDIGQLRQLIS